MALPALVGALLGAGAGYLGVERSIEGQLDQQSQAFDEDREQRSDDRRGEVYAAFLDAANHYAFATAAITSRLEGDCADDEPPDACFSRLFTELVAAGLVSDFQDARFDYQGALNDVFVFGSDEAVDRSRELSANVPTSLATPGLDSLTFGEGVDGSAFTAAYRDFLALMCEELPAQPRQGCTG